MLDLFQTENSGLRKRFQAKKDFKLKKISDQDRFQAKIDFGPRKIRSKTSPGPSTNSIKSHKEYNTPPDNDMMTI